MPKAFNMQDIGMESTKKSKVNFILEEEKEKSKGGRPSLPDEEKLTAKIFLNLTKEEKGNLSKNARSLRKSVSTLIRELLIKENLI